MLLLGYIGFAQAQTFCVEASAGKDIWMGTSASPQCANGPWRTINRVKNASFIAGDTILLIQVRGNLTGATEGWPLQIHLTQGICSL